LRMNPQRTNSGGVVEGEKTTFAIGPPSNREGFNRGDHWGVLI